MSLKVIQNSPLLFIAPILAGIALTASLTGCSSGTGGNLAVENVSKVKIGMTLDEVREIIGGRERKATQTDLDLVNQKKKKFGQASLISFSPGSTLYCWRQGKTWFFVSLDNDSQKVTFISRWSSS